MIDNWFSVPIQMMQLGMESQFVIFQRMLRLQKGGVLAQKEISRMITEKMIAAAGEAFSLSMAMATARPPQSVMHAAVKSYRKKVSANRRRLRGKTP